MLRDWWELPGPASFVISIHDDLLAGMCVVLGLPLTLPDGLRSAVRMQVEQNPLWNWTSIKLIPGSNDPVACLTEHFSELQSEQIHDTRSLSLSGDLARRVIWLEGFSPENWVAWRRFISAYCGICKDIDLSERGLIIFSCSGSIADEPPESDVALSIQKFQGKVNSLDISLWLACDLERSRYAPLERQLRIAVACELAGADPELALELAKLDLETLFAPSEYLTNKYQEVAGNHMEKPDWSAGMLDDVDGEPRIHLSYLAARGIDGQREIQQRIWSGQLRVLFPRLERERIEILSAVSPLLKVPWDTGFGVVSDKYELEIGHIFYQVKDNVDRKFKRRIRILMDIRNALAHRAVVSADLCRELIFTPTI